MLVGRNLGKRKDYMTPENGNLEEREHTIGNSSELQNTFEEWILHYDYEKPRRGQFLQGEILVAGEDEVIVDVGVKRDAFVPRRELEQLDEKHWKNLSAGEQVTVCVTHAYTSNGNLLVSIQKGMEWQDWERVQRALEEGEIVEAEIIDRNKGGLVVKFGTLCGFIPRSHLDRITRDFDRHWSKPISEWKGKVMQLKVIEIDRPQERLIFSEREACREQRRQRLLSLEPGQIIDGRVTRVLDYGAFVDLDGVDGLIHISELDWNWVTDPSEIVQEGDEVRVLVDDVDLERERVSLSRKKLILER